MKIGRLNFPTINKNKFNYDEIDYVKDDSPDCVLSFNIKNDIAYIEADWKDDFSLESLITLLLPIATGSVVDSIFMHLSQTRDKSEVKYLQRELIKRLKELQAEREGDEVTDNEPVIQPLEMMQHIMAINNPNFEIQHDEDCDHHHG